MQCDSHQVAKNAAFGLAVFAISLLLFYFLHRPMFFDPDLGWRLATGRLILDTGIPAGDVWSYTAANSPWFVYSWLWDASLYFIVEHFGMDALRLLVISVFSILITLLALHTKRRHPDIGNGILFTILLTMAICVSNHVLARSIVMSAICLILLRMLLERFLERPDNYKLLVGIASVMVLWVNTHASFSIAFLMLAAYGVEPFFRHSWGMCVKLVGVGLLMLLSCLVNPYGLGIVYKIVEGYNSPLVQQVTEFNPAHMAMAYELALWLLVCVVSLPFSGKKNSVADYLICLIWLILTFIHVRFSLYFIILSFPVAVRNMHSMVEWINKVTRKPASPLPTRSVWFNSRRVMMLSSAVIAVISIRVLWIDEQYAKTEKDTAKDSVEYILKYMPEKRFVNDYNVGGQVIFFGEGRIKVFIDGRGGIVYSDDFSREAMPVIKADFDKWLPLVEKYGIEAVITCDYEHGIGPKIEEYKGKALRFKRVFKGEMSSVYLIERPVSDTKL